MRCYITGRECNCGAFDVAGKCPFDEDLTEDDDDDHGYDHVYPVYGEGRYDEKA